MGILDRIDDEYLDVSTSRATLRELLDLVAGSITFVSQAYWAVAGRSDYDE